ncbi:thiopeptide-type bacteriocin biosynthesis protein [Chitinophaga filiformis]|uniref:thiopeptide-type bacteriocin biosynthesis protein n=1 Tax=Chitinophaga filiformis TaxID=104663 RepID=UPI001F2ABA30|nr:thiopeptide-type bacteriocin biosynthesis protein [Chitinophaga filiformis]MCF6407048.1 thiopeptide-type bacteriocin biosynthesis protein [Chitinophaga filiformis]
MQLKWLSAYLFSNKGLDRVLREQVAPFIQAADSFLQAPSPYFFIRYGEGGPHIRLRLHILQDEEPIVKAMLDKYASVRYVPYIPEIERYGNAATITLAEQQFSLCSDYILSLICDPEWDTTRKLSQAIQLNMALLYAAAITPEEIKRICAQFIRSWLPGLYDRHLNSNEQEQYFMALMEQKFMQYAPVILPPAAACWSALQQDQPKIPLQGYAGRHITLLQRYQQLINDPSKMRGILCSLLHMQHNRLGVPNTDEAYIVFFTMKCVEHIYDQIAG